MIQSDGTIRTDDMALAAVLRLSGFAPAMVRVRDRKRSRVTWILSKDAVTDEALALVEEYTSGDCRVEPQAFMREVRVVRRELYALLGVSDQPRGSRIVPSDQ